MSTQKNTTVAFSAELATGIIKKGLHTWLCIWEVSLTFLLCYCNVNSSTFGHM